jgi:uncharacterized membrane protein
LHQLLLAILLTISPVLELRAGMPVAIDYAVKNNISVFLVAGLIIAVNILVVFLVFLFLDFFHGKLLKIGIYRRFYEAHLRRLRKRVDRLEQKYSTQGFIALTLFVAVPLPTTGAWSGVLIAWILGLERKKSFLAISAGVTIAGIIVALASRGLLSLF